MVWTSRNDRARAALTACWAVSWLWASAALATGVAQPTDRIVSLGGAVTEILFDLGAGDRIVGIDTTSVHPAEAVASKPSVGYLRQLSAEGILSLRPTLVIAVEGAGPPDALKLVEGAGVRVAVVPDRPSPAGVRDKIETVARLIRREQAGTALAERVEANLAALADARRRIGRPVRALFILSLQNGRAMVGGRETTADGMFALAGAENAAASIDGFKPMSDEAIVAAAPDVVVMMSRGPGGPPSPELLRSPALAMTPAGREGQLVVMNGLYLLGFGPRTAEAARELMATLYPGMRIE